MNSVTLTLVAKKNTSTSNHPHHFFIYIVAIIQPLIAVPQIIGIWINQNTQGVSVLSWMGYTILALCWTIYGLQTQNRPLIIANSLNTIANALVVFGVLFS
ncbi:hypothetical protein HGA91_01870 [candidate division WWE3 bacterium]|nr:hypothetical protein [candidate division WWE3 bacterium]